MPASSHQAVMATEVIQLLWPSSVCAQGASGDLPDPDGMIVSTPHASQCAIWRDGHRGDRNRYGPRASVCRRQ